MCTSAAFKCPACGNWTEDYGKGSSVCIDCELDFEVAQDAQEPLMRGSGGVVYSTEDPGRHILDGDLDPFDYEHYEEAPVLVNPCPSCNADEVYHPVLTRGLCLNCYHIQEEENRLMDIEFEHDRAQGLI